MVLSPSIPKPCEHATTVHDVTCNGALIARAWQGPYAWFLCLRTTTDELILLTDIHSIV